jgi:hypothetical protein
LALQTVVNAWSLDRRKAAWAQQHAPDLTSTDVMTMIVTAALESELEQLRDAPELRGVGQDDRSFAVLTTFVEMDHAEWLEWIGPVFGPLLDRATPRAHNN